MSPRAACRLAALGFPQVHDYVPGKADWLARGLPVEGAKAGEPRAIDRLGPAPATARPEEPIAAIRARVEESPYAFALVTTADGVLLGRLRRQALRDGSDRPAAAAMEPGPSTVRADTPPADLLARLERADLQTAVVTDPDGRLLGVVRREDLERR